MTTAEDAVEKIEALAPVGVDHIMEVAFAANLAVNTEVLALGGSVSAYATDDPAPALPFWELFKNARIFLVGSDDVPQEAKQAAAQDVNAAFEAGWKGYEIAESLPLSDIARAHELVDQPAKRGRVVLTP